MLVLVLFLKIFNPFLQKSTIGVSEQKKNIWHSSTVSVLLVRNNFIKNLLTTKSDESKSVSLWYSSCGSTMQLAQTLLVCRMSAHGVTPVVRVDRSSFRPQRISISRRSRGRHCRVLSLSDCKYSLNPLSQTRIDKVGLDRIRCMFKLSCT